MRCMTLTTTEFVELNTLEAIERLAKRATTGTIELDLTAALPRLEIAKQRVNAILADALRDLQSAGYLDHAWLQAVDEHWHPVGDREWVWTLTASGESRLDKLRITDRDGDER